MVKVNQAERGREFVDRISINLSLYTYFTLHSSFSVPGQPIAVSKVREGGVFPRCPADAGRESRRFCKAPLTYDVVLRESDCNFVCRT